MLSALAGGDALEIIVALKDLTGRGFEKVQANIKGMERTANGVNLSGAGKKMNALEKDAARAAGSGGVSGLASGLTGLVGPAALAAGAIGGVTLAGLAIVGTYDKIEKQQRLLDDALKAHGSSLDAQKGALDKAIKTGETYGMTAEDTTAAVTRLTQAGLSFTDIQAGLPAVMSLAIAKNMSAADAADLLAKATVGSARGLTDLGIKLPPVSVGLIAQQKASKELSRATDEVHRAQDHLALVEDSLRGKHHLTAAQALRLREAHDKLKTAEGHLKKAHHDVGVAADVSAGKAKNFAGATKAVLGATGDAASAVTPLAKAQAQLNDAWDRFSTAVGPGLETALSTILGILSTIVDALSGVIDKLTHMQGLGVNAPYGTTTYQGKGASYNKPKPYAGQSNTHARGGWVGLSGPEIALVGEQGPEYVNPAGTVPTGGGGGVHLHVHSVWPPTPQQIRQIADVLDRAEYWRGLGMGVSGNRA